MKTTFRIIADIIIFYSVIQGWWFVAGVVGIFGIWYFSVYIEALIAGFAYDSIFGVSLEKSILMYAGTISASLVFVVALLLKKILR